MRLSQAEKLCLAETAGLGFLYAEVSGLENHFGPDPQLAQEMARKAIMASRLDVRVEIGSKFVAEQADRVSLRHLFLLAPQ